MSASPPPHPAIDTPLAFVDLETTGGSAAEHRITEIGVVVVNANGVSTWTTLVDPQ
ncbi:exonuclease, DNA polymerase III, epsilon subunit family/GIY-YIG catalytic domain protein, partial [Burkholderia pseudomallei Pakistan 9]